MSSLSEIFSAHIHIRRHTITEEELIAKSHKLRHLLHYRKFTRTSYTQKRKHTKHKRWSSESHNHCYLRRKYLTWSGGHNPDDLECLVNRQTFKSAQTNLVALVYWSVKCRL